MKNKPDFSKIKALLGKIIHGRWDVGEYDEVDQDVPILNHEGAFVGQIDRMSDAALIVELRNNIESIMEYVSELEREVAYYKELERENTELSKPDCRCPAYCTAHNSNMNE